MGSSAPSNAANALGTGSLAKPVQASGKTGPPLARGSHGVALELSKAIAQLPATVLGSKHEGSLAEIDIVVKEQESPLEDIAINGTLPGQSRAIGVNELKNVLKSSQVQFDDLKKALDMATPLREKVEEQKKRG